MAHSFEGLISYITGVDAQGQIVAESFASWNGDTPATYGTTSDAAKWGAPGAGTGATISYAFDAAANWSIGEKAAFLSVFALSSAVANVRFVEASETNAQLHLTRAAGAGAAAIDAFDRGTIGGSTIGTARSAHISLASDVAFGSDLSDQGGYGWGNLLHGIGHVLGLGDAGPYAEYDRGNHLSIGVDDLSLYTAMSNRSLLPIRYQGQSYSSVANYNFGGGEDDVFFPTAWQEGDILALQRLYGRPTQSPLLAGGITFGFNSSLTGPIAKFYDFTQNTQPIVTLWSAGPGNRLDLSGYSEGVSASLVEGSHSSVGGLTANLTIAQGTRIDTLIGGAGDDLLGGNDNPNVLIGGAGSDNLGGGAGSDHLYGGGMTALAGDGVDYLSGGLGGDYLQGNAGDDFLYGEDNNFISMFGGSDRIQGGQGNDVIVGGPGNDSANGNLGNDTITGGIDNDSLRGGQGDDLIQGQEGNDIVSGDRGIDTVSGGTGNDLFNFNVGDAHYETSGANAYTTDIIESFEFGADHIDLSTGIPSALHALGQMDGFAEAEAAARMALTRNISSSDVAWSKVGVLGDLYFFYGTASSGFEAVKLGNNSAFDNQLHISDFI